MSLEAFISGHSVISSSGSFAPNNNPDEGERRRSNENKVDWSAHHHHQQQQGHDYDGDEEEGEGDGKNIVLAERTSQLMSSYRDYITGQEDEQLVMNRVYGDNGNSNSSSSSITAMRGENRGQRVGVSPRRSHSGSVGVGGGGGGGIQSSASLLREWNSGGNNTNNTSRCELEVEQLMWDQEDGSDRSGMSDYFDPASKDIRYAYYTHPIYHSKKFKRFVLAVLVAGAVVGIVSLASTSRRGKANSKMSGSGSGDEFGPDWEEELKEVLLEEEQNDEGEVNDKYIDGGKGGVEGLMHQTIGLLKEPAHVEVKEPVDDEVETLEAEVKELQAEMKELEREEGKFEAQVAEEAEAVQETDKIEEEEEEDQPQEEQKKVGVEVEAEEEEKEVEVEVEVEAEEVQSKSNTKLEGIGAISGNTIEAITRHILCCSSKSNNSDKTKDKEDAQTAPNSIIAQEYETAESYRPRWYKRSSGWNGSTYAEALEFCTAQQGQDNGDDTTLCPYEVYCPTGPHHIPLGGYRMNDDDDNTDNDVVEDVSRAPISDYANGWVQVGMQNVCVQYTIIDPENDEEDDNNKGREDDGDDAMIIIDAILEKIDTDENKEGDSNADVAKEKDQVEDNQMNDNTAKDNDGVNVNAAEASAIDKKTQEVGLVEETYVPIHSSSNINVNVGANTKPGPSSVNKEDAAVVVVAKTKDQVAEESQSHLSPYASKTKPQPQAVHKEEEEEDKQESSDKPEEEQASSSSTTTNKQQQQQHQQQQQQKQDTTNDMTNILHQKFKPLWLSSKEGWNGGSHSDAVEFCKSIRGKMLCPYSAMCPHGPGNAVMGGRHRLEFEVDGEQYAPVMGGDNHWVMIGNGGVSSSSNSSNGGGGGEEEGSSASNKCMTHRQLEGRAPQWGLSGDRAEVKKHIMCCTIE